MYAGTEATRRPEKMYFQETLILFDRNIREGRFRGDSSLQNLLLRHCQNNTGSTAGAISGPNP
jgi:hypothetical protein